MGGDLENLQCVRFVSNCTLEISPVFSPQGLLQFVQSVALIVWFHVLKRKEPIPIDIELVTSFSLRELG